MTFRVLAQASGIERRMETKKTEMEKTGRLPGL